MDRSNYMMERPSPSINQQIPMRPVVFGIFLAIGGRFMPPANGRQYIAIFHARKGRQHVGWPDARVAAVGADGGQA